MVLYQNFFPAGRDFVLRILVSSLFGGLSEKLRDASDLARLLAF